MTSLSFLDIADAETLYIGKSGASSSNPSLFINKAEQKQEKLFKITEKGEVLEVVYKGKNQQEITNFGTPERFFKMNDEYLFFEFRDKSRYLVNKTDGKVYQFDSIPPRGEKNIKTDSAGNIYFQAAFSPQKIDLIQLNIQDPENITIKPLLPNNHSLDKFSIDKKGNIAYIAQETNTGNTVFMYIPIGQTKPVFLRGISPYFFWEGLDGKIYYCGRDGNSGNIHYYRLESGISKSYYSSDFSDLCSEISMPIIVQFKKANRILAINSQNGGDSLYEIYNETTNHKPKKLDFRGFSVLKWLGNSDNYYYLQAKEGNKDVVLKVNQADDSTTKIMNDQYIIYKFSVDAKDNITFQGLKKSDMITTVFGKVSAGKVFSEVNIKVLSDNMGKNDIKILKRIR